MSESLRNSPIRRREALRVLGAGALAAAGTGALSGCVPEADPAAGGDAEAATFGFTAWSLNEAAQKDAVKSIVDAYAAANKVTIKTASYPYNDYLSQLTLKLRGGQVTGAVQVDVAWVGALAGTGRLIDLGRYVRGGYTEVALRSGQHDGTQYGLPWTTGSIGLIANTDILEKAGVTTMPRTIEEFEEALTAVKGRGGGVVPYAAATKVAQLKDILPWMQTFGSPLLRGNAVAIGDDASVRALAWYKKLYDAKLIAPDVDRFDARALFAQGRAAFYDDAIVAKGVIAKQAKDKDLAAAMEPLPRPVLNPGDPPQALVWGHVIAVVAGTGSASAARFAAHTTSDTATAVGFFEKVALPPTTTAGLNDPKVKGDAFTTAWTEKITKTATPSPFWRYAGSARIDSAIAEQVQAALVGKSSPKDAMSKAAATIGPLLK
jgi:ABC-type glycerol-3-phosphate transport system substrate-binding protein